MQLGVRAPLEAALKRNPCGRRCRQPTVPTGGRSGVAAAMIETQQQHRRRRPLAAAAAEGAEPAAAAAAAAPAAAPGEGAGAEEDEAKKSEEYTTEMQAKMGTGLTYRHEDGMNWHHILPDVIVGSCLQCPDDVDRLAGEGITTIFCLQEDSDLAYFDIDIEGIRARAVERGDIRHVRFPVRDFDPFDLRKKLPKAVAKLAGAHQPRGGTAYIHCTAGLGRAPATALAYMYWLRGWELQAAYDHLTSTRTCSPRIEAVRAATADLLTGSGPVPVTISLMRRGTAKVAQVAGLDVGWHQRIDLAENPKTKRLEVTRELLPGSYPFKFVIDEVWSASADYPCFKDGANTNNVVTVLPRDATGAAARDRLLSPTGLLTEDERLELAALLCPWDSHDRALHMPQTEAVAAEAAAAAAEAAG
ncbi:phosphoglucan phosphatase [Raphidocelis subcapitata]|uniref:Phosphoglucan phosphatase n=1 Tax=Raphidocelis subcapitata TaxID=307507 RepID=A0A2V0NRB5_9CHLO|nr:phosphoglucan phosphatase [Raphidocelis subcapitata]|eukprot:GBF90184.1 phosphoglucan phosphatase [Raphidocelis subcapitata]